jgi:hypothetical protein
MPPRRLIYIFLCTALILTLAWCAGLIWVNGQLRASPLRSAITTHGGVNPVTSGEIATYSIGSYLVRDVGLTRLAIQGRARYRGSNTKTVTLILPKGLRGAAGKRQVAAQSRSKSSGFLGWGASEFTETVWTEGDASIHQLWDWREHKIEFGRLFLDGHEFNLLDRPRLIILDKAGNFIKAQDLPADLAPPPLTKAAKEARAYQTP